MTTTELEMRKQALKEALALMDELKLTPYRDYQHIAVELIRQPHATWLSGQIQSSRGYNPNYAKKVPELPPKPVSEGQLKFINGLSVDEQGRKIAEAYLLKVNKKMSELNSKQASELIGLLQNRGKRT